MAVFKSGQWNAVCDRCGFRFKSSELKKDWQGLMVCEKDFELRNPQDFLRVRPEKAGVPWSRPESDIFLQGDNLVTEDFVLWGVSDFSILTETSQPIFTEN